MKTAFITGGTRGIGRAIAFHLVSEGWSVGVVGFDPGRVETARKALSGPVRAQQVGAVSADVTDYAALETAVERLVDRLGYPQVLINNAGRIDAEVPLWEADPAQWKNVLDTNLLGAFNMERLVVPSMIKSGSGRVINMVTGAGAKDYGIFTAYTSSKAGLIRNVGDLHVSGYDLGLRAFGIAPGVVATDMTAGMELHAGREEFTPIENTLDLVQGIVTGQLDAWSGTYLRATDDTTSSLIENVSHKEGRPLSRTLGVLPWGSDDPLSPA